MGRSTGAAYERYLNTGHPATTVPFATPAPFGQDVLITDVEHLRDALEGKAGTLLVH